MTAVSALLGLARSVDRPGDCTLPPAADVDLDPPPAADTDLDPAPLSDDNATPVGDTDMEDDSSERSDDSAAVLKAMTAECSSLREENLELRARLNRGSLREDGFRDDDDKVKLFTGIPSFALLMTVLDMITPFITRPNSKLSGFQMCLLTFMRMHMNLGVQFLGHLFGVSASTASRIFYDVLTVAYTRLVPL